MNTRIRTHTTLKEIRTTLGGLKSGLEHAPTHELVRVGADLWDLTNQLKGYTEFIKNLLRGRTPNTRGQHLLKGPGASCMVTMQGVQPILRKGVELPLLRTLLGEDFDKLFNVVENTTPRTDFEEALQRVKDPDKVQVVLAAVDITVPKPRVSFQLKLGSK